MKNKITSIRKISKFTEKQVGGSGYTFFKEKTHDIPVLPVLDQMVSLVKTNNLLLQSKKTAFIGVQHMLETTGSLFNALIQLGINPKNMFFTGKCYSSSELVVNEIRKMGIHVIPDVMPSYLGEYHTACKQGISDMWKEFFKHIKKHQIENVCILDEGLRCIDTTPNEIPFEYPISSIEQTRAGLYSSTIHTLDFPLVEVASSAIKTHIEPPLIATAIIRKLEKTLPQLQMKKNAVCGVIGMGAIGSAVIEHLLLKGFYVLAYDENQQVLGKKDFKNSDQKLRLKSDIPSVLAGSQYIFGCTGRDITKGIDVFDLLKKDTTFISCTSEDKEFLSLLKAIAKETGRLVVNPLADVKCMTNNKSTISILRGGYPINFDNSPWNVPAKDIEITQGLLFGACLQALMELPQKKGSNERNNELSRQMLNPYIQQFVLKAWFEAYPENKEKYGEALLKKCSDIEWLKEHSGGTYKPNDLLKDTFEMDNNMNYSCGLKK